MASANESPPPARPPPPEDEYDEAAPPRPPPPSAPARPPAPHPSRTPQRAAPKPPRPANPSSNANGPVRRVEPSQLGKDRANSTDDQGGISRSRSSTWSGKKPAMPSRPATGGTGIKRREVSDNGSGKPPRLSRSQTDATDSSTSRPPPRPKSVIMGGQNVALPQRPALRRTVSEAQTEKLPARPPPPPPGRPAPPPAAAMTRRSAPTPAATASSGGRSRSESVPVIPTAVREPPAASTSRSRQDRPSLANSRQQAVEAPSPKARRFSIRGRKRDSTSEPQTPPADESAHPTDELGILNRMVVQCVGFLNQPKCLNEEGLFRVPGDMTEIQKIRSKFIRGVDVDLSKVNDPNTVAGLLKLHYRELRFSIVPRGEPIKSLISASKNNDIEQARKTMEKVPEENFSSLKILLELLWKVAENSDVNKMNTANLGHTVGMAIFHDIGSSNAANVLRFLIEHRQEVFP